MPSVCFYFQVHQPWRLREFPFSAIGVEHDYFDENKNREILLKVASKCYLPANRKMLELIIRHEGRFRIAFSISGVAIEQMQRYAPEVLESFQALAKTGCVEFLAETYYHSLSFLYDRTEFAAQVQRQRELIEKLFHQTPRIFRNTELVYRDDIGKAAAEMGFQAILAEGWDPILDWRSPNFVYEHPEGGIKILCKNYRLSDDIAFRFSNRGWNEWPLTAPKFAEWVHRISGNGETVNLFMDYETFGEHQWKDVGIFEFLDYMPGEILKHGDWNFKTPSEILSTYEAKGRLSYPHLVSWADTERDLSAWNGNQMQRRALAEVYGIAEQVRRENNPKVMGLWGKLQTSDHFYYMCTKWFADGDVHAYFNPYKSPYEAFLNYMNALTDFRETFLEIHDSFQTAS